MNSERSERPFRFAPGQGAIVTGAASGLGLALTRRLAAAGAAVALIDIDGEGLKSAAEELGKGGAKVSWHVADVSKASEVEAAVNEAAAAIGPLHFICANAGVGIAGVPFSRLSEADAHWAFGVNYFGAFNLVRAALPRLRESGTSGAVLLISSAAGLVTMPGWHIGLYSGTKMAVAALGQALADELEGEPIGVSIAYPGLVATNIVANAVALRPTDDAQAPNVPADLVAPDGMPADTAATIVLDGVQRGVRHIFTHPEIEGAFDDYVARIKRDFANAAARAA